MVDSFENPKRFMVGEVFGDVETIKKFCAYNGEDGLHTIFLFQTLSTPFKAKPWRKMVEHFEANFSAPQVPTYVFSNHDRRRSITPLGNKVNKAKLLALFQYTVRGIPFTYYGEELGIEKPLLPLKTGKDPLAQRYKAIPQFMVNWTGQSLNRDECRTPMLWNTSAQAGFTTGTPWLPVAENYKEKAVEVQDQDQYSLMRFYQKVIHFREEHEVLQRGGLEICESLCSRRLFAYYRTLDTSRYLVLMNFSKQALDLEEPSGEILLSTLEDPKAEQLGSFEGRVVKVSD